MINIRELRKVYGEGKAQIAALDSISLTVQPGEIFGVLGQSGAGKSTLIRCINQLETPSSGSVIINGQVITELQGLELRRARQQMGMLFQHFNLLSSRTVAKNILGTAARSKSPHWINYSVDYSRRYGSGQANMRSRCHS